MPRQQALSAGGMVRLGDKQPKDGERVRVKLSPMHHAGTRAWHGRYLAPTTERSERWMLNRDHGDERFPHPDDRWEPMGASDE